MESFTVMQTTVQSNRATYRKVGFAAGIVAFVATLVFVLVLAKSQSQGSGDECKTVAIQLYVGEARLPEMVRTHTCFLMEALLQFGWIPILVMALSLATTARSAVSFGFDGALIVWDGCRYSSNSVGRFLNWVAGPFLRWREARRQRQFQQLRFEADLARVSPVSPVEDEYYIPPQSSNQPIANVGEVRFESALAGSAFKNVSAHAQKLPHQVVVLSDGHLIGHGFIAKSRSGMHFLVTPNHVMDVCSDNVVLANPDALREGFSLPMENRSRWQSECDTIYIPISRNVAGLIGVKTISSPKVGPKLNITKNCTGSMQWTVIKDNKMQQVSTTGMIKPDLEDMDYLKYYGSTLPGSSGALVYVNGAPVAMHQSARYKLYNSGRSLAWIMVYIEQILAAQEDSSDYFNDNFDTLKKSCRVKKMEGPVGAVVYKVQTQNGRPYLFFPDEDSANYDEMVAFMENQMDDAVNYQVDYENAVVGNPKVHKAPQRKPVILQAEASTSAMPVVDLALGGFNDSAPTEDFTKSEDFRQGRPNAGATKVNSSQSGLAAASTPVQIERPSMKDFESLLKSVERQNSAILKLMASQTKTQPPSGAVSLPTPKSGPKPGGKKSPASK